jgi:DNA-binding transcriptional ArsR family regulator
MPKRLDDVCEEDHLDREKVRAIQEEVVQGLPATLMAQSFKGLSDPSRIRIISVLREGEISVFDLASVVAMTQSAVSHQLATLRDADLVKYRKSGRKVYYSLQDDGVLGMFTAALAWEKSPEKVH